MEAPKAPPATLKLAPNPVPPDLLKEEPSRKTAEDSAIKMELHGEFRTMLGVTNMNRR